MSQYLPARAEALHERVDETADISADWWVLVGVFQADLWREDISTYGEPDRHGYLVVVEGKRVGQRRPRVVFQSIARGTRVHLTAPDNRDYWNAKLFLLSQFAAFVDAARQRPAPTAEALIERYDRARAQGRHSTLKQLAAESGYHDSSLRSVKAAYDNAGKWGSTRTP